MEALQQRLEWYRHTEEEAKSKGESTKATQYERIIKVQSNTKHFYE